MFTTHIPRTGKLGGNSTHSPVVRFSAALGTAALVASFSLAAPTAASASSSANEAHGASYAHAEFLSGSLLGADLDNVVGLGQVSAANDGTQSRHVSRDPLAVDALTSTLINLPSGLQLPLLNVMDAGIVNQYAQADNNGKSLASTGAIQDDGGIGVGSVAAGPAGDLTLNLDSLLSNEFASVLDELTLDLDAVSARADGSMTAASGDYTLADARLSFSSPAISQLTSKVANALSGVDDQLLDLGRDNGALGNSIDHVLDPILGVVDSSADVRVVVDADLQNAVSSLLRGRYSDGAVSVNLDTGAVIIDLETLMGGNLNDLPPNTELLSDAAVNQILNGIAETVSTLADQIVDRVELALRESPVTVSAQLNLLTDQNPVQSTMCTDIPVPMIGDIITSGPGSAGNLGGVIGGLADGITETVTHGIIGHTTDTVCTLTETLLPDLRSTVDVNIVGTVDGVIGGAASTATTNISLLGGTVKAGLDGDALIGSLGTSLNQSLFSQDGVVTSVVNHLNSGLVDPAVTGLLGDSGVATVLHDLVSIKVNVQEKWTSTTNVQGKMFSETAVRVGVGSGQLATLNVAHATVGPNVQTIIDPGCTKNCGPGGTGDPDPCVDSCIPRGPDFPNISALALGGQLAYTGAGVVTLIALIVALLVTGAYFARRGYLRTHPMSKL